jgi:hypothetical protein
MAMMLILWEKRQIPTEKHRSSIRLQEGGRSRSVSRENYIYVHVTLLESRTKA